MNQSRPTYEKSNVTRMNELCHTYEPVTSHVWISQVTHMNASWHAYECVTSHVNESCPAWERVMSHMYMWTSHVTLINESWDTCDVTHSYVWHDSLLTYGNESCQTCKKSLNESCHTCKRVMAHIYFYSQPPWMCDVTRLLVWHDSFPCVTRLIPMRDMNDSYIWCEWFIFVTWLLQHR